MYYLERIPVGVEYIGGIVSRIVFQSCAGRNVVSGTSGHCGLVEGQRTFDVADGQNHVVEHRSPPQITSASNAAKAAYLDFTTNSPFARPTRSSAEERRQDSLQV